MKNYLPTLLFMAFFCLSISGYSQSADMERPGVESIDELSIYPNPVSTGKIYIITKQNLTKEVEIFDVLGKKIFSTSLFGKELNISELTSGVYILKIKENNISATRKLVVK
ncbi:MAG TPA: T9SS type A sorting domain-containing protein [Aquaticitalea sp.]|nr:T9SS type A sorting domain-containing protein [Aquaticitalea sp.]